MQLEKTLTDAAAVAPDVIEGARKFLDRATKGKGNHSWEKGIRNPGERMVYRSCERTPSLQNAPNPYSIQIHDFKADPGEVINRIVAMDRWDDDTGGFMQIINGGINQDHVILKAKSRLFRGQHFTVEIFTVKKVSNP